MSNSERAIATRMVPLPGSAVLRRLWQYLVAIHRARQTRAALDHLDDRMLKDIGLERSEIGPGTYRLARGDCGQRRHLR